MKGKWLLIVILVLAFVLRIYKLGSVPPHLTSDEAALGYNTYSILKTGRDEYGKFLPIIFKSFGDYKPGLYVYSAIPAVAVLGLNEFSVRLPSAIAGVVTVYLIYLTVGELFKNQKLQITATLIAAICPWLIYFSRGAWEVNLSLTLTLGGVYFFFKSLKKSKYLVFSALCFALTLIAYQGAKLSTGIVILILAILYWKQIIKFDRKKIITAVVVGFVVALPILISLFTGKTGRLTVFSVFSYPRPKEYLQSFLDEGNEKIGSIFYYLFHSENVNFLRGVLGRYFNHFSVRFLFFEGDWANPRHSAPNQGMLLLGDMALIVVGIIAFVKTKLSRESLFVWLWLLLAPLPSILSRDQVHAVRSFNMVIPLVIILSYGLLFLYKNKKLFAGFVIIYAISFIYFLDAYFIHLPIHNSQFWGYGYKQIVETVTPIQNNYKTIKIEQSYAQPYIYFLFYQKYDPAKYQKVANLKENPYGDVGQVEKLDNIEFSGIDWSRDRGDNGDLIVADTKVIPPLDSDDPKQFKLINEIKYLDNKNTAFRVLEIK